MNPARFGHRISFYKDILLEDDIAQEIVYEEKELVKTVWADVKTMKGSEYFAAASTKSELTYRFITRYTTDISNDMEIRFKGRIFEIIEPPINDDELNITLTIIAKERL